MKDIVSTGPDPHSAQRGRRPPYAAPGRPGACKVHEDFEGDPRVPSNLAERYLSGLQQADQVGTRNVQEARRLLRAEFHVLRNDLDAAALCEQIKYLREHDRRGARDDLLTAWNARGGPFKDS